MSNFAFLASEWPAIDEAATQAEASAITTRRTSCFYARRARADRSTGCTRRTQRSACPTRTTLVPSPRPQLQERGPGGSVQQGTSDLAHRQPRST